MPRQIRPNPWVSWDNGANWGGAHGGLADPNLPNGPDGNGLNAETSPGAILRIDVNGPPGPGLEYRIPRTNPFFGLPGAAQEISTYGLRNRFRFFLHGGPGGDGRLFLADVG